VSISTEASLSPSEPEAWRGYRVGVDQDIELFSVHQCHYQGLMKLLHDLM